MRQLFGAVIACAAIVGCARPAPKDAADSNAKATDSIPRDTSIVWLTTDSSVGPIRVGMSIGEAAALAGVAVPPDTTTECAYLNLQQAPGASLMVVKGIVERVDVRDSLVLTREGARVGDTEAHIKTLYPGAQTTPHKYSATGHYLTVTPTDSARHPYRMIFETDSGRVTRYRVGRVPAVAWVEGCS